MPYGISENTMLWNRFEVFHSDARNIPLEDKTAHTVVTSPPYAFSIRRYDGNTASWWQENKTCVHVKDGNNYCQKCKAWFGTLGNEDSIEQYSKNIAECMDEVKRVLRDDGVVWMVVGDMYKNRCLVNAPVILSEELKKHGWSLRCRFPWVKRNGIPSSEHDRPGVSHEDVLMLYKTTNSPRYWIHPDKVGTRVEPEPDYEYIHRTNGFKSKWCPIKNPELRAKMWRRVNKWLGFEYYYDRYSILVPLSESTPRYSKDLLKSKKKSRFKGLSRAGMSDRYKGRIDMGGGGSGISAADGQRRTDGTPLYSERGRYRRSTDWIFASLLDFQTSLLSTLAVEGEGIILNEDGLPIAVAVNTKPMKEQHFAAYPKELVEPLLKATVSSCACSQCGAPWHHIVNEEYGEKAENYSGAARKDYNSSGVQNPSNGKWSSLKSMSTLITKERWVPTCNCGNFTRVSPVRVLDPFTGTGTTGVVALRLGSDFYGTEAGGDYKKMSVRRLELEGQGKKDFGQGIEVPTF